MERVQFLVVLNIHGVHNIPAPFFVESVFLRSDRTLPSNSMDEGGAIAQKLNCKENGQKSQNEFEFVIRWEGFKLQLGRTVCHSGQKDKARQSTLLYLEQLAYSNAQLTF